MLRGCDTGEVNKFKNLALKVKKSSLRKHFAILLCSEPQIFYMCDWFVAYVSREYHYPLFYLHVLFSRKRESDTNMINFFRLMRLVMVMKH